MVEDGGKEAANLVVSSKKKKMVKKTQSSMRETKQQVKDESKANSGLFASCSFSSLGLDPKLSEQLKGSLFFPLPMLVSFSLLINKV